MQRSFVNWPMRFFATPLFVGRRSLCQRVPKAAESPYRSIVMGIARLHVNKLGFTSEAEGMTGEHDERIACTIAEHTLLLCLHSRHPLHLPGHGPSSLFPRPSPW